MKPSVRNFFKNVAEEREGNYNPGSGRLTALAGKTQEQVLKAVGSMILPLKFSLVLDVGAGPGRYIEVYGQKKAFHVLVDGILPMLNLAKKRARTMGFSDSTDFIVADLEELPIRSRSVDFVSCIDTLHHVDAEDKNSALGELARVATETGYVFIEMKNKLFPHYMIGLSRRNPTGTSIASNYFVVRAFFRTKGFQEVFSVGALPWSLAAKILSPSILLGFRK